MDTPKTANASAAITGDTFASAHQHTTEIISLIGMEERPNVFGVNGAFSRALLTNEAAQRRVMLKYSDEVKIRLRASGMTDVDITKSELRAEQNLRRFVAVIRHPSVSAEKQRRFARRPLLLGAGADWT